MAYNQLGSCGDAHLNSLILEDEAKLQIQRQIELQNESFPQNKTKTE